MFADFEIFADANALADAGYRWATTSYGRNDDIQSKSYDSGRTFADYPEPGSVHAMLLGLVPVS